MPIFGHFLPSAPGAEKRFDARRKLSLLASGLRHDGTGLEVKYQYPFDNNTLFANIEQGLS